MREFLALIKKWMTRLLAGIATVLLSIMTLLVLYQVLKLPTPKQGFAP